MENLLGLSAVLWDQLLSYETAIQEINYLYVYIEKVSKQKPVSKIQQDRQKLKISTAENVKQMYEHYCCRKWTKIESTMQQLISSATVSGIANIARPNLHITRGNNLQAMNIHEDADLSSGNVFNECDRGN